MALLLPRRMARIKSKVGIKLNEEIERTNLDEYEKWKTKGKFNLITQCSNTQRKRRGTFIVYCRAVRLGTIHACRTHCKATAIATAVAKREEEGTMIFIAPDIQY